MQKGSGRATGWLSKLTPKKANKMGVRETSFLQFDGKDPRRPISTLFLVAGRNMQRGRPRMTSPARRQVWSRPEEAQIAADRLYDVLKRAAARKKRRAAIPRDFGKSTIAECDGRGAVGRAGAASLADLRAAARKAGGGMTDRNYWRALTLLDG